MRELVGEQARILHRGCKIVTFEFSFDFHPGYRFYLTYNNEMNKVDVNESEMYPINMQVADNKVFCRFRPYSEDRLFQLEVWNESIE